MALLKQTECASPPPLREYTHAQELADNLPYFGMLLLGAAILRLGLGAGGMGWLAAGGYVGYGLAGMLWIIVFLCPYCHFHGTRHCPCGYGQVAARLRAARDGSGFARKFRRHIPVIVPLWLIPPAACIWFLCRGFSWPLLVLLVVFAVDAFVLLPLVSTRYGCAHCPQKETCPWMHGKQPTAPPA